jgi:hypothetical protein
MRYSFLILFVLLLMIISHKAHSQQHRTVKDSIMNANLGREKPVKALLKTSILAPFTWQVPLTGEYRVLGEMMIGKRQSAQVGASYLTRSVMFALTQKMGANAGNAKVAGNGYRLQASYKYYLVSQPYRPEGIFVSLHSSLALIRYSFKDFPNDYQTLQHFNINLLIGGQVLIANRLSIELFVGPGYKANSYVTHARPGYEVLDFNQLGASYFKHIKLSAGMNIGVAL